MSSGQSHGDFNCSDQGPWYRDGLRVFSARNAQGGTEKVSLRIFAITSSTASLYHWNETRVDGICGSGQSGTVKNGGVENAGVEICTNSDIGLYVVAYGTRKNILACSFVVYYCVNFIIFLRATFKLFSHSLVPSSRQILATPLIGG